MRTVAAEGRRRRSRQFSETLPPRYLGGYALLNPLLIRIDEVHEGLDIITICHAGIFLPHL